MRPSRRSAFIVMLDLAWLVPACDGFDSPVGPDPADPSIPTVLASFGVACDNVGPDGTPCHRGV